MLPLLKGVAMSFLDEVDSLRAKVGIGKVNPLVLVGVSLVALLTLVAIAVALWGGFTSPGIVVEHEEQAQPTEHEGRAAPAKICVHVVGEVAAPGMYELDEGSRVSDCIQAAGGMLEGADQLSVNLARPLADGEQVIVSSKTAEEPLSATSSSDTHDSNTGSASGKNSVSGTGKVNINTASASELTSLDGVGDATAAKIIAYRQANGSFSSIEEIKKVSGIGDKKFEALKDRITV